MTVTTLGWPTHILTGALSQRELVDETVSHILQEYNLEQPPGDINSENIFDDPKLKPFKEQIVEPAFDEWLKNVGKSIYDYPNRSMRAWITGTGYDYTIMTHNHSGAHLSAVFYLFNDSPGRGGELVLFDPRANANRAYKSDWNDYFGPMKIRTPSYTFAVFPSFVYHQTTPFKGKLRLAIPVDLFI